MTGEKIGWVVRYHAIGVDMFCYVANPTAWIMSPNIADAHVFGCVGCIKGRLARTEDPKGYDGATLVKIKKTVTIEELAEGDQGMDLARQEEKNN